MNRFDDTGKRRTQGTNPEPPFDHSPTTPPAVSPLASDKAYHEKPILYTAAQAAELLQVRPSWLRRKAAARAIPCRYVGKHLRFARSDIDAITDASATHPHRARWPHRR